MGLGGLGSVDSPMYNPLRTDDQLMLGNLTDLDMDYDSITDEFDLSTFNQLNSQRRQQESLLNSTYGDQMHDSIASGAGAGPLPCGFGIPPGQGAGSGLTEFTKRRNWSHRVLDELRDFLHVLTPDGRILYVSPSCKPLTGFEAHELHGKSIMDYIHSDDSALFVREFNESIASGNALRFFYRFRKADDTYTIFESHGHPHISSEVLGFGGNSSPNFCPGFFMMARPYPTKNAALLDSFLEHKIENERLIKRIADLKREEQEDQELQQQPGISPNPYISDAPPDTFTPAINEPNPAMLPMGYTAMPPPAKPTSNTALTRQNLDQALLGARPDSINDKMARYEGATHLETIEMLTGLRYRDGERSQGISTGDVSPMLIRGDAGINVVDDKDKDGKGDKMKKRAKMADEYVCMDCGTLDSPEWRKGPTGPKTLCNACGLRWAKKEKKQRQRDTGSYTPSVSAQPSTTSS